MIPSLARFCRACSQRADVRRLLLGASWLLGSNLLVGLLSVVKGLLLARLLGVEQYGIVGLTIAYVTMLSQIFDARSTDAVIRFGAESFQGRAGRPAHDILRACLTAETLVRLLGTAGICLTASWVSTVLLKSEVCAQWMRWYSLTLCLGIPYGACSGLVRLHGRFSLHGRADVLAGIMELSGVIWVGLQGANLERVFAVLIVGSALRSGLMLAAAYQTDPTNFRAIWPWYHRPSSLRPDRELLHFLFFSNFLGIVKGVQANLDTLVVAWFLTPLHVGYYRIAKQIAHVFSIPAGTLYLVAFPELARGWQEGGPQKLRRLVGILTAATALGMLAVLVPLLFAGERILALLAGPDFADAWPTARILLLGTALYVTSIHMHAALVATGFIRSASNGLLASVLVYLVGMFLFTALWGLAGATWSYMLFAVARLLILSSQVAFTTIPPSSTTTPKKQLA